MGENVLKLIYYILYSLELFFVGEILFRNRVKEKIRYIVLLLIYILILAPIVLVRQDVIFLIPLALNILIYVLLFQGKLSSKLARFLGVYIFTGIVEGMISGIGTVLLQQPLKNLGISSVSGGVRLLLAAISALVVLVITTREWIHKFMSYFKALKWFQYIAIIMIAESGTLLMAMSDIMVEYIDDKKIGIILHVFTILLLGAIFIGIIWFASSVYSKEYYFQQNRLKEEFIRTQQQYYQSVYENDREMRKFRHDINAQLGCLQLLLNEKKIEQALQYLETIENNFRKLTVYKYCTGNEILNVIVNQKCMEAKKRNINLRVEGKVNRGNVINGYDLCTIFSNAINNSMEACEIIQNREKIIYVSIVENETTIFFQFVNPATIKMYEAVKKRRTLKGDTENHGFGIENIKMAVEKYNGELEYRFEDEKLILEIYFEI